MEVDLAEFEKVLGLPADRKAVVSTLARYDVKAKTRGKSAFVSPPPYRDDYIHPWDAVEDFAVSLGYDRIEPEPLSDFTLGGLDPLTEFGDRAREIMVGLGFEEIISNILTSPANVRERTGRDPKHLLEIDNVYSETYSVVRDRILPSLLEVEAESVKAAYPHRLFEEGDTGRRDRDRAVTERRLAALVAGPAANFSEIHGFLSMLLYYLDVDAALEAADHEGFIPGRAANLVRDAKTIGILGELHPGVLDAWGIKNPAAAFELDLNPLSPTRALS
jgi:phenylalanyl-tRNA synthetase beta chain